jgi:hypothetical protein
MATLWERFVDWAVRDAYTLEERELMRQQARRLKLATDLQEERIRKRKEREEHKKSDFRTVAVWKQRFKIQDESLVEHFYLQQTPKLADGTSFRRLQGGPVVCRATGKAKQSLAELGTFERAQNTYVQYVLPWREWSISTAQLEGATDIEVIRKEKK